MHYVSYFMAYDNLLIAARKGSPLAIGHGNGEMFVGSDAIALAPMTNQVTYSRRRRLGSNHQGIPGNIVIPMEQRHQRDQNRL